MNAVTKFEWTPCQQGAIDDITQWSFDREATAWALVGSAGTGKSTVVRECLQHVKQKYGICVSAPTHKAKDVIHQFTGEDCFTIQKLLGLRPNLEMEDFDIHKPQFEKGARPKIRNYALIVIDEASMLSLDLFNYLMEQARTYKTKLLFVGDALQLPPVGEDVSPALNKRNVSGVSLLKTPVRQSFSNPLSLLLLALRCDIEINEYNFNLVVDNIRNFEAFEDVEDLDIRLEQNHGKLFQFIRKAVPEYLINGEGYMFTKNLSHVVDKAIEAFATQEFAENIFHAKYLAYNGNEVEKRSTAIRNALAGTKEPILVNDLLTGYNNIVIYPEMTPVLINSEDYKVVEKVESSIQMDSGEELSGWVVKLKALRNGREVERFIVNPDMYDLFIRAHRPIHTEALKRWKWRPYYQWKNELMLLNDLNKKFRDKKLPSKDLGYIYGSTVHKSQGSTYNKVFVDGLNIGSAYAQGKNQIRARKRREPTQQELQHLSLYCRRLMYVALSRARQSAIIHL